MWFHGLIAATITSFSTAGMAFLTMPDTFNFSGHGLENAAKIIIAPTAISVLAYLKQSPLPTSATVEIQNPKLTNSGLTGSSATMSIPVDSVASVTAPRSASITVQPKKKSL